MTSAVPRVPSLRSDHQALAAVVDALAAQEDQLVERMLARMRAEVPESFFSDPAVYQAGVDSIYQNLRTILVALRSGREVPEPPSGAIAEARVDAQSGSPLDGLIQSYRIGHSVIWEAAMDEMDGCIPDVAMRGRVLRLVSRFLFAYIDRVVPPIVDAYEQERDAQFRDREQRKRRLVRDLIAGLPIDTSQLAYDLSAPQLAVISWGSQAERAILQLGETVGCRSLTVPSASDVMWGWLSGGGLPVYDMARLRRFAPPDGTFVALGDVLDGLDGFRRTHGQAWQAYQVASIGEQAVTLYRDVSLLALMLQDQQAARTFVVEELGALAGDDAKATVLRETLSAYFAAAAAALQINDRTVAYRVRSAETRLGFPISTRRDELGVALRLAEIFSDAHARSP